MRQIIAGTTSFRCMSCDNKQSLTAERQFECAMCKSLLDVHTSFEKPYWRDRTEQYYANIKLRSCPGPDVRHRSGVWRFHELIWPDLPITEIVSLGEGMVPIVPAGKKLLEWIGGELNLHIILEGQNPSGSFKDQGMTALVTLAKHAGVVAISMASTGDTSASGSAYAAAAGIGCTVILPEGMITAGQLTQPVQNGARVIMLPGDFDACMRVQNELIPLGCYPANSKNPMRIAGHTSTAFLFAQYFGWRLPDWICLPVGNGSNSTSVGMGMRRLVELDLVQTSGRILGCQTEAANPLARSWQKNGEQAWRRGYSPMKAGDTIATATKIGAPVSAYKVMREVTRSNGAMQTASEIDIRTAMDVCLKEGLPVCPQTGIAIAGLRNAVRNGTVAHGSSVGLVSTATSLKFPELYKDDVEKAVMRAPDTNVSSVARMLGL